MPAKQPTFLSLCHRPLFSSLVLHVDVPTGCPLPPCSLLPLLLGFLQPLLQTCHSTGTVSPSLSMPVSFPVSLPGSQAGCSAPAQSRTTGHHLPKHPPPSCHSMAQALMTAYDKHLQRLLMLILAAPLLFPDTPGQPVGSQTLSHW